MLLTIGMLVAVLTAGIVIGAVGHERIAEKGAATKSELAEWVIRMKGTLISDEKAAKNKLQILIEEIERKL